MSFPKHVSLCHCFTTSFKILAWVKLMLFCHADKCRSQKRTILWCSMDHAIVSFLCIPHSPSTFYHLATQDFGLFKKKLRTDKVDKQYDWCMSNCTRGLPSQECNNSCCNGKWSRHSQNLYIFDWAANFYPTMQVITDMKKVSPIFSFVFKHIKWKGSVQESSIRPRWRGTHTLKCRPAECWFARCY